MASLPAQSFNWGGAAASVAHRFVIDHASGAGEVPDQVDYGADASAPILGVTDEADVAQFAPIAVHTLWGMKLLLEAGAAVTQGALVTSDATGRGVATTTARDFIGGEARTAAGAAGDLFWIIFKPTSVRAAS